MGTGFTPTDRYPQGLLLGLDVGSTTVKFVVVEPATGEIVAQDYQRHDTKPPEKCIEMLRAVSARFPDLPPTAFRIFATGSGGAAIARRIGARFVQEVNAVALAVEKLYPDVESVIELGGQDAKIIVFRIDDTTGRRRKIPSMNDKCAGGTGAVIDKISRKLGIAPTELAHTGYLGLKLHPVAGKCGVFAETDINGLQKQGVPADELMASLFESIVQQNVAVLTRGHTLRPRVLLLGGPNAYIRGLRECWRHHIPLIWRERKVPYDDTTPLDTLIIVPEHAPYFGALGAVEFARLEIQDHPDAGTYRGLDELQWYVSQGRAKERHSAGSGLWKTRDELADFKTKYAPARWIPARFKAGTTVTAFLGIDGGSTSTKAVLLDEEKRVIAKAYQLSRGNPIEDAMTIVGDLARQISDQACRLDILAVGTTGYAKDILKEALQADVALVETVAHTRAGLHFYPDADVIVDTGGQDIKLIILRHGQVKDFKLNTQCSAGNGYFLQSTAEAFGFAVADFAEIAFGAEAKPSFGYGCAVFMQSDIVDFQRQGWAPSEIMAGLCAVLPKNIWLHVAQLPNLATLGRTFVLQGGTQHNLAAVKAQVDFIAARFRGTGVEPSVVVHRFCGEAGAIGCAVEAHRLYTEQRVRTRFVGVERVREITYRTTRSEATRCYFCKNKCLRTFIDVRAASPRRAATPDPPTPEFPLRSSSRNTSKVPLTAEERRSIIATCEKGTVEDVEEMRAIKQGLDALRKMHPNFAEICAREAFQPSGVASVADPVRRGFRRILGGSRPALQERRHVTRIGMARVLNMYSLAPWFMAYFEALGLESDNLVWSDPTSPDLYREGATRGAIDPCFPSKVGIPHVHNLLYRKHAEAPLDCIFFPMIDSLPTFLDGVVDSRACPAAVVTPEAVKAAFTKESDLFAEQRVAFLDTFLTFAEPALLARQLLAAFGPRLGLSRGENERACETAWNHYDAFYRRLRRQAREVLDQLEREAKVGVVLLDRPYHHDPGVCHEIPAEFQKLGIPVFTADVLPRDPDILERLFGEEVRGGEVRSPLAVEDVWKNAYSENTSRKVWAAKYAARHPNLVALELSSFKCGHDAPIYAVVEEIVEASGTPYFCFKDIDENRPSGSIKIRIETIAYFLRRYREKLAWTRRKTTAIEARLAELEQALRAEAASSAVKGSAVTVDTIDFAADRC